MEAVGALDEEVAALFPKGELWLDTHANGEELMLGFDVAAGANKFLA
jgi:hypothetical protein